jgi:hypothetical protein
MGDNIELNSHVLQMRDTIVAGDHEIIFRGNVSYNVGAYALQSGGIDYVRHYNNTFYQMLTQHSSGLANMYYNAEGGDPSINNHNFNNIFADIPVGNSVIYTSGGSSVTASNNICYHTANHASCVSTADPKFVNANIKDFHLQSDSPAIGAGKPITTVSSPNGSGTSFNVVDAGFFTDGFGIVTGDNIKVGSNSPVTITNITGNTITVDQSVTWVNGDGIFWRNQDSNPDIGAYEFRAIGYQYDVSIDNIKNGALVDGLVTIQAKVTNAESVRYVIFYINGIPVSAVNKSPYTYYWNTQGLMAGTYKLEVIAYSYYADKTLFKNNAIDVILTPGLAPLPPQAVIIE